MAASGWKRAAGARLRGSRTDAEAYIRTIGPPFSCITPGTEAVNRKPGENESDFAITQASVGAQGEQPRVRWPDSLQMCLNHCKDLTLVRTRGYDEKGKGEAKRRVPLDHPGQTDSRPRAVGGSGPM